MESLPNVSLVDLIACALVALLTLSGFIRGFSRELGGLIGGAVALAVGLLAYNPLGDWLQQHTQFTGQAGFAVAYVAAVVTTVLVLVLLRWTVGRIVRIMVEDEDGVNHFGGALAGGVRGALIVAIVFIGLNLIPVADWNRRFGDDSLIGTWLRERLPHVKALAGQARELEMPAE